MAAWRIDGEGWANTFTDGDGAYSLSLGEGEWEITVYRPWEDRSGNWIYDELPAVIDLGKDQTINQTFTVAVMEGGSIKGKINLSDINASVDVTSLIYIDVFDPRGRGDWTNPGSDGTFEVKVRPGEYEVSIWIDPALGGYADFNATYYRVGKNAVDIGEIDFIDLFLHYLR